MCLCALTVGCGRVSVPVISPKKHVEGEVRNIVALKQRKDREKHEPKEPHRSSSHGEIAGSKMATLDDEIHKM